MTKTTKRIGWISGVAGAAALGGVAYVATSWYRYGRPSKPARSDPVLDLFMPAYEVVEQHETRVAAPADITYAAARAMDLQRSRVIRAIFRGRELLMRSTAAEAEPPGPLVDQVLRLGWRVLAETPGREIVLGAVTKPWEPNVRFEGLPPEEFAGFDEPGYAKIIWNLSVEPVGPSESVFRTETRVITTDRYARKRFRRYWSIMSPGISLIRHESLGVVKRDAERRFASQPRR